MTPCDVVVVLRPCVTGAAHGFHDAEQLLQRENTLFKAASVVLIGGRSLDEAKRDRRHDVHCMTAAWMRHTSAGHA
jgi:hypothetical protein